MDTQVMIKAFIAVAVMHVAFFAAMLLSKHHPPAPVPIPLVSGEGHRQPRT